MKTLEAKVFILIYYHHKCVIQFFPFYLNTFVMGLRPLEIFYSLTVRGSTLDVRIWRLQTADSDV